MKKLKIVILFLIISVTILSGIYYKQACDNNAKRFYKQGMNFYKDYKFSDAYYNFKQIRPFSSLYEISLLKQYQCANNLSDKKTAILKLRELIKTTKSEYVKIWAYYNEAILSQELNLTNVSQLKKKYNYIHQQYPKTDFGIASAYKVAQLSDETEIDLIKKNYLDYLAYAPNGKFAKNTLEALKKIDVDYSQEEYEIVANAELANELYQDALKDYKETLFLKNWYKISKCYKGLKNKEQEIQTIIKGLELNYSPIDEKELSQAIERLVTLKGKGKIVTLQELYVKYPNSYAIPTIGYMLAEASSALRAIKLYELVAYKHPQSIWASNALWEIFWYNYTQNRFKACEKLAKKHMSLYKNTTDAPRVAYWYGRTLLKSKKNSLAREIFYDVINDYPLSYYSFLSARRLKESKAKKMILRKQIISYNLDNLNKLIFKDKLLLQLAQNNDWQLIEEFKINDDYINSLIQHKKDKHPVAINLAKNKLLNKEDKEYETSDKEITYSNQLLKLIYPIYYEKLINTYAKEFKQSPYLFLSLVREESHFDKNAKSAVGALGLSQIMPDTASFIEKSKVKKESLFEPENNIKIGLKYFNYLVNQFDNDEYLAILAYNAGPGNVKKWKNNPTINSDEIDVFVENIPFIETKNYIKKILSSYWIYLNIYSTKNR